MAASEARTRRAALALHALAPADRERVLAMLDDAQRAHLKPALHELHELGIPPSLSPAEAPPATRQSLSMIEQLSALQASVIVPALSALSPSTIATLLRVAEWPWGQAALEALPGPQRVAIRVQGERVTRPGPRMCEALCRALDAAVQKRATEGRSKATEPPLKPTGWWPWKR
jgi:hypothetical protein